MHPRRKSHEESIFVMLPKRIFPGRFWQKKSAVAGTFFRHFDGFYCFMLCNILKPAPVLWALRLFQRIILYGCDLRIYLVMENPAVLRLRRLLLLPGALHRRLLQPQEKLVVQHRRQIGMEGKAKQKDNGHQEIRVHHCQYGHKKQPNHKQRPWKLQEARLKCVLYRLEHRIDKLRLYGKDPHGGAQGYDGYKKDSHPYYEGKLHGRIIHDQDIPGHSGYYPEDNQPNPGRLL